MKAAKTWLPDMTVIGIKPFWNVSNIERQLHEGFSRCWYEGEWFELIDEGYYDALIDGFTAFSDTNRDVNSVDFIYWFGGEGFVEFSMVRDEQKLTLPKFLQQESDIKMKQALSLEGRMNLFSSRLRDSKIRS
jgi:hypothetical protein